jgi:thioredoxin-like negative regulator of GroEL
MEDLIGNVNDTTFDAYFNAPASVVVYGIANCEGCAYMDGVLTEVAPEFQGKVRFGKGKMHVPGASREIKKRFTFETYPTIHLYSKGKMVESREGTVDPAALRASIQSVLQNPS